MAPRNKSKNTGETVETVPEVPEVGADTAPQQPPESAPEASTEDAPKVQSAILHLGEGEHIQVGIIVH